MGYFFAVAGAVVLMMTGTGTGDAVTGPGAGPALKSRPEGVWVAQRHREDDVAFVKAEAFLSKDGKKYHVKGAVRNVNPNTTVREVTVTVRIYDEKDTLLFEETVPASPDRLAPGEEGTFEVIADFNASFHRVNRSAAWKTSRW